MNNKIKSDNTPTPPGSRQKRFWLGLVFLIVIFSMLVYVIRSRPEAVDKAGNDADIPAVTRQADKLLVPLNSPLRARLAVQAIAPSQPDHTLSLPGIVEADPARTVNILPPLTGRLMSLKVKLGDSVQAGQIIATMSSPDLAQAFADADKARDASELALRALERAREVNKTGANASKDMEQIQSAYVQAEAENNRAAARLKTLGVRGETDEKTRLLNITSPIAGTVTVLNNGTGSYINDATATMMTIANLDSVWVTANVPEDLVATVQKGQAAEVTLAAYAGKTLKGKIDFLSAIIEPDTRRNKARISFANADGKLKPNMFANVKLAVAQTKKIVIPTSALLMNNDSITVFVEVAPWVFVRRTVELDKEDGEQVSILSGLSTGERIIVRGGVLLND